MDNVKCNGEVIELKDLVKADNKELSKYSKECLLAGHVMIDDKYKESSSQAKTLNACKTQLKNAMLKKVKYKIDKHIKIPTHDATIRSIYGLDILDDEERVIEVLKALGFGKLVKESVDKVKVLAYLKNNDIDCFADGLIKRTKKDTLVVKKVTKVDVDDMNLDELLEF